MTTTDPHANLRAAFAANCRIQAWHLNEGATTSNDGRWDTLAPEEGKEPKFGCEAHLYRVHPDDAHLAPKFDGTAYEHLLHMLGAKDIVDAGRIIGTTHGQIAELTSLAARAIPFLEEVGNEFDDDGNNEPLELARDIRAAVED